MKVDKWVARKEAYKFMNQMNGKTYDRGSFYYMCLLVIANCLIYIGDCISNLKDK